MDEQVAEGPDDPRHVGLGWLIVLGEQVLVLPRSGSDVHGEAGIPLQHRGILVRKHPIRRVTVVPAVADRLVEVIGLVVIH